MTVIKLALAAAALGAAAHPTPKVVLVKHADFIRQTLSGATQYFVRTVSIGKEDLGAIHAGGPSACESLRDDERRPPFGGRPEQLPRRLPREDSRLAGGARQVRAALPDHAIGRDAGEHLVEGIVPISSGDGAGETRRRNARLPNEQQLERRIESDAFVLRAQRLGGIDDPVARPQKAAEHRGTFLPVAEEEEVAHGGAREIDSEGGDPGKRRHVGA